MCHRGTAGTGKSKTQTHVFEFASCFFYIRIRLVGSDVAAGVFGPILIKCCIFNGYTVFGENVHLF